MGDSVGGRDPAFPQVHVSMGLHPQWRNFRLAGRGYSACTVTVPETREAGEEECGRAGCRCILHNSAGIEVTGGIGFACAADT